MARAADWVSSQHADGAHGLVHSLHAISMFSLPLIWLATVFDPCRAQHASKCTCRSNLTLSGAGWAAGELNGTSHDGCSPKLAAITVSNETTRNAVVFDCGRYPCDGVGDRMAGILGAGHFALESARKFVIVFPTAATWFDSDIALWVHNSSQLAGHIEEGKGKGKSPRRYTAANSFINPKQLHQRTKDSAMVHFAANRAVSAGEVKKGRATTRNQRRARHLTMMNRCLMQALFQPSSAFLAHRLRLTNGLQVTVQELGAALSESSSISIAVHLRANDEGLPAQQYTSFLDPMWSCLQQVVAYRVARQPDEAGLRPGVVYVLANFDKLGHAFLRNVSQHVAGYGFDRAWMQQKRGLSHSAKGNPSERQLSLQEALIDWWAISKADILRVRNYGGVSSGFSVSAGLLAHEQQLQVDTCKCRRLELCAGRFC